MRPMRVWISAAASRIEDSGTKERRRETSFFFMVAQLSYELGARDGQDGAENGQNEVEDGRKMDSILTSPHLVWR